MAQVVVNSVRPNVAALCGAVNMSSLRLFSWGRVTLAQRQLSSSSCVSIISCGTTTNYTYSSPLLLCLGLNRGTTATISSTKPHSHQRRSIRASSSYNSTNQHHDVNDSGTIDSPLIDSMQAKIKEQLNAESVIVKDAYGDGRHVSIDVISSVFEGESAVSRQRMVYKAIWEELQNTVHAVDQMTTKTPSEAATSN